jgi:hypothetical protein
MQAIELEPKIEPQGLPFFAKLRAEADGDLLADGAGQLYLGFHLDPIHGAHWNNLTKSLSFKLDVPEGVKMSKLAAEAPQVDELADSDPREFLLDVESWPADKPVHLTVTYFACVGKEACHAIKQEYTLHLRRDRDAGKARGEGAGFWDAEAFARQNLARDKNGDGKLDKKEVQGLIVPYFESFDSDHDGLLDGKELLQVSDWLNYHHQPGAAPSDKRVESILK